MDMKAIDAISKQVEAIAKAFPHMRVYLVIAQPCAAHNGLHMDLASCGAQELVELMDRAIASLDGVTVRQPPRQVN